MFWNIKLAVILFEKPVGRQIIIMVVQYFIF